jgi:predicted metal-dependent phosphoesterase TrpH
VDQGGLVYIPHPFETVRSGISATGLAGIASAVDIIETTNGRAIFQNRGKLAARWAVAHGKPGAASSDSHGKYGWGLTYSIITEQPTRENLAILLGQSTYGTRSVGVGLLYPKYNRLRKRLVRGTR